MLINLKTLGRGALLIALIRGTTQAQVPAPSPPPACQIPASAIVPIVSPEATARRTRRDGQITLAVLPLEIDVDDVDRIHLPWALQDGVASSLAHNDRLRVASSGSVARAMAGSGGDRDSAAALLGAQFVLTGRVTEGNGQQEVQFAMFQAGRPVPVWTALYNTSWTLPKMEEATARGVEHELLGQVESEHPKGAAIGDAAFDAVAAGDFALRSNTVAGADSARVAYERALALDPRSPLAATRVALAYVTVFERGGTIPGTTFQPATNRVVELTKAALRADPAMAEAWTVRAMLARLRDPVHFAGATEAHARAISLAPNDAEAEHEFGVTLMRLGEDKAAEAHLRRALALEANRASTLSALSELMVRSERWVEACAFANASVQSWPFDPVPYAARAQARLRLGQTRDAYADAETAVQVSGGGAWLQGLSVLVAEGASNVDAARREAVVLAGRWLAPGSLLSVRDAIYLARAFLAVNDQRRAVEAIRRARPVGADLVTALRERGLAPIRADTTIVRLSGGRRMPGAPK